VTGRCDQRENSIDSWPRHPRRPNLPSSVSVKNDSISIGMRFCVFQGAPADCRYRGWRSRFVAMEN